MMYKNIYSACKLTDSASKAIVTCTNILVNYGKQILDLSHYEKKHFKVIFVITKLIYFESPKTLFNNQIVTI